MSRPPLLPWIARADYGVQNVVESLTVCRILAHNMK